ncbi:MAG: hypothetical protein PHV06_12375 [bacterium]|nr:hypothetical protein [bacterium]
MNEKILCKKIRDLICRERDEKLISYGIPDVINRNTPDVDYKFTTDKNIYVIEHTLIESFEYQIQDDEDFSSTFSDLQTEFEDKFRKDGCYLLIFPINSLKKIQSKRRNNILQSLKKWILNNAPRLRSPSMKINNLNAIDETPPGVPFKVSLRFLPGNNGKFLIGRFSPDNLEKKREVRIRKAIHRKSEKLKKAKGKNGISIMAFEYDDISLGNYVEISSIILKEYDNLPDLKPDNIYLVNTSIDNYWVLYRIVENGINCKYFNRIEPF